jgi:hypothetical protein
MKRTVLFVLLGSVNWSTYAQEKPNPFTGTTAAFEQRLRILEEKKLDAAIANEELAAEKANQERTRLRSGRSPAPGEVFGPEAPKPTQKMAAPPSLPSVPSSPNAGKSRAPRLVGTISTPAGWVALVEAGDRMLNVPEGASVAGVKVNGIDRDRATVNGIAMTLETVTARVAGPATGALRPSHLPSAIPTAPADVIDLGPGLARK